MKIISQTGRKSHCCLVELLARAQNEKISHKLIKIVELRLDMSHTHMLSVDYLISVNNLQTTHKLTSTNAQWRSASNSL